jgi:hypothetical protein
VHPFVYIDSFAYDASYQHTQDEQQYTLARQCARYADKYDKQPLRVLYDGFETLIYAVQDKAAQERASYNRYNIDNDPR